MIHSVPSDALAGRVAAAADLRSSPVCAIVLLALVSHQAFAQEFRVQIISPARPSDASPADRRKVRSRQVTLDLDSYVESVLAGEASVLKNRAALQAMAILARTWALRYRGRHRAQGFDFCSSTHCQAFRWPADSGGRFPVTITEAVSSTRNRVLKYQGQLADPYFSADCGGMTESAGNLWPDRDLSYLPSLADPYCSASVHTNWRREIALEPLIAVLRNELKLPVAHVQSVSVRLRDSSGRVRALEVVGTDRFPVDANQFRYAVGRTLGWDILKSNLYTVEREGDAFVFRGRGLGHGVGLCQAGADAMAGLGAGYDEILAHYFPGTEAAEIGRPATLRLAPVSSDSNHDPVASSEHFELSYPESQEAWVNQVLGRFENWRRILAEQFDPGPGRIRVQTWDTTEEFIHATGEPGWAGGSTDGHSIFLQPLGTLAAKRILDATLRHELTHIAVRRVRAPGVTQWFEEGFVLFLTGERVEESAPKTEARRTLGEAIAHPHSAREMYFAYAKAVSLVRQLAAKRGQNAVWKVLEQPSQDDLHWLKREEAASLFPGAGER
jgi:stage II sporulation protein D